MCEKKNEFPEPLPGKMSDNDNDDSIISGWDESLVPISYKTSQSQGRTKGPGLDERTMTMRASVF